MKKSKVIVPAMALLLFSTAASITGTVAWFSSTRSFSTSASTFVLREVEGGLEGVIAGGVGTHATDSTGEIDKGANSTFEDTTAKAVRTNSNVFLTHGSFNPDLATVGNRQAWIINRDSAGTDDTYVSKGLLKDAETTNRNWQAYEDATNHYYVAFSWTIRFTYTFNSETKDVGLYFNQGASKLTVTPPTSSETALNPSAAASAPAFRIAFIPLTGFAGDSAAAKDARVRLWCTETASTNGKKYVTGASSANVSSHADGDYLACDSSSVSGGDTIYGRDTGAGKYSVAGDCDEADSLSASSHAEVNKARADYLCTLSTATGKNVVYVKCVAWFEGEDAERIKSGNRMDTVKADMSFYVRSNDKATA